MKIDLLKTVENGGCSVKLAAKDLDELVKNFPILKNNNILVDNSLHDDAGVYKITEDLALIFTTDFFPPICSDPFLFGKIAATNSLSDVYAMGGKPIMALNINTYPSNLPIRGLAEILRGGNEIALEAGVAILGGHTIEDATPKYGLAVVGIVDPLKIVKNSGLKIGQKLILTKPIGSSAILAAQKAELASPEQVLSVLTSMSKLNDTACRIFLSYSPSGGTDITGFGLAGHLFRMALASKVSIELINDKIPIFDGVKEIYNLGCIPNSTFRNREFVGSSISFSNSLSYEDRMIFFDAQTSGGLCFAVEPEFADNAISRLVKEGVEASIIGSVLPRSQYSIYIK